MLSLHPITVRTVLARCMDAQEDTRLGIWPIDELSSLDECGVVRISALACPPGLSVDSDEPYRADELGGSDICRGGCNCMSAKIDCR